MPRWPKSERRNGISWCDAIDDRLDSAIRNTLRFQPSDLSAKFLTEGVHPEPIEDKAQPSPSPILTVTQTVEQPPNGFRDPNHVGGRNPFFEQISDS